jgi:uncharacterized membrane protein
MEAVMKVHQQWRLEVARNQWRRHPGVRPDQELTRGERAADRLRNGMGSWTFVFGALIFLAGWTAGNRNAGFDPYPFILLNLLLSCVAALQGAILLIAARRSDQISAELALHDYQTDQQAAELIKAVKITTDALHAHLIGAGAVATNPTATDGTQASPPAADRE